MNEFIQCNIFNIPKLEELAEFPDRLVVEHEQNRGVSKAVV